MFILNFLKDYQRIARFRFGNFEGMKGPGPTWLIPIIHSGVLVDLRTEVIDIPRHTNITKDNAPIDMDYLLYIRVKEGEASKSVLEVENYKLAVIGLATTTLRAVVGEMTIDDVLSQREKINRVLRQKLADETERWGIEVTNVEIKTIEPAPDIQESMNRQMAAERVRRAVIIEAEGTRQAAITVAEGSKQAAILDAEGQRQSEILAAEGDQQAALLRAEGFSGALARVDKIASEVSPNAMSLQYFDTLTSMGQGESTKYIFPMEFTSLLKNFIVERNSEDS
jgi:regulator of protease activity HflC (stomatin/prohibitin superfamily)